MIKNLLSISMLTIAQIQIAWANYDRDLINVARNGNLNKVKSLISKGKVGKKWQNKAIFNKQWGERIGI